MIAGLPITTDSQADWHRSIVSLRRSVALLSRFVDDPDDLAIVQAHEAATKPVVATPPVLVRPFEESSFYDPIAAAIRWPFEHPCASRYSAGGAGVWYGARHLETAVRETVHHFRRFTLMSDAARTARAPIVQERRLHLVACRAVLVDLRARCESEPRLLDPDDYGYCQALGAQLRDGAQPGVLTRSARHRDHDIVAVFSPDPLHSPRTVCHHTYRLDPATGRVLVERTPRRVDLVLDP